MAKGSPKKSARLANFNRRKTHIAKVASDLPSLDVACSFIQKSTNDISLNFEIITPYMQIRERNDAYQFFKP
jgi:hypothetical protein